MDKILRLFLLPFFLLTACSVKEDRGLCPCELSVRSNEALLSDGNVLVSVIQDGAVVKQGMMSREDFERGNCVLTVPRKPSVVTVFTGVTGMNTVSGRRLDILSDHECDELYSCMGAADLRGDAAECIVTPHKNYARLYLTVLGMPSGADLRVVGSVDGYDLVSLDPCEGLFQCGPTAEESGETWRLRLPRQTDDSLGLDVVDCDGALIRNVRLGKLIAATGYSYDDEDLLDVSVTVDLSSSSALVHISGWETDMELSIDY